jgi:hypothetical protein
MTKPAISELLLMVGKQPSAGGIKRPILLKKSAMVSTKEKYALDIEIFTLSRGFLGSDFAYRRANKAFSAVSMRAVWKNRLFQQNRPIAAIRSWRQSAKLALECRHRSLRLFLPARRGGLAESLL